MAICPAPCRVLPDKDFHSDKGLFDSHGNRKQTEQTDPGDRQNKTPEEAKQADRDESGKAEILAGHNVPPPESGIGLGEEQHQDEKIIHIGCREGDDSGYDR